MQYKMVDGFPELYIDNDTSSPAALGEFSSVVATYHSQVCKHILFLQKNILAGGKPFVLPIYRSRY